MCEPAANAWAIDHGTVLAERTPYRRRPPSPRIGYTERMCGRIVRRDAEGYRERFEVADLSETRITPRFNIAPTQLDLHLRTEAGARRLVASRWGLIPSWAADRRIATRTFNARAETLAERPAFRTLIARHRCIIPASGFYEWQTTPSGKQPLYIHRADGAPLALAGLWTEWRDPASGEVVTSHTVITCAANHFMAAIHQRMPVLLDGDALAAWLDPGVQAPGVVLPVLAPCADDLLTAYPVAPLVNNVHTDDPALIAPLSA